MGMILRRVFIIIVCLLSYRAISQTLVSSTQCNGDWVDNQSSGAALGGIVVNNLCLASSPTQSRYYKIATLHANNETGADHLHLTATLSSTWSAYDTSYFDLTFANRGGFIYEYTGHGHSPTAAARVMAYRNSDTTVDVYLMLAASSFSSAGYTILENAQETIYPSPAYVTTVPSGTLVFDTSSGNYRALSYISNDGNYWTHGKLVVDAPIYFPDGTVQSTAWNGTLCGGDYAESVNVSGDRDHYAPGDVMVVSATDSADVAKSSQAYSTLVAGVYSTRPGVLGRRQIGQKSNQEIPMAMVGIVPTKVSAENGSIRKGDLLVTSSIPGYAMKGTDPSRMLGAIVGKALGNLDSGTGTIEVMVSLQ
jgi:hypothetical protein